MPFETQALDRGAFDNVLDEASQVLAARRSRLEALGQEKRVVVYSYGIRGTDLALQLRGIGVDCVVFDNAASARARAAKAGFETSDVLPTNLPVIVAAGQNQVEILGELGPEAHSLADALWAYDIRNSYGRARAFSAITATRRDDLYALYQSLEPDSRAVLLDVLRFRASLDVEQAKSRLPVGEMWAPPVPVEVHSFCDVGAYDGDTLKQMKGLYPGLTDSFTVEPNPDFDPVIDEAARALGLTNRNFIGAAWSKAARLGFRPLFNDMVEVREAEDGELAADTLDAMTGGQAYDYVKFDVESSEAHALDGARSVLSQARLVAVAAYHLPDDLIEVPRRLAAILGGGWALHLRHYSQSFDDSIVYAVRV